MGTPLRTATSVDGTKTPLPTYAGQVALVVSTPKLAKVDVNGAGTHPLRAWLEQERRGLLGGTIRWGFAGS